MGLGDVSGSLLDLLEGSIDGRYRAEAAAKVDRREGGRAGDKGMTILRIAFHGTILAVVLFVICWV